MARMPRMARTPRMARWLADYPDPFARNLREFGVAWSEELEVNQWIAQDIHWLSRQSEHVKNTIHCFSMY